MGLMRHGFTDKSARSLNHVVESSHGQFRAKAEAAGKTTEEFAREHEHDKDKTGKQARLALVLMAMHHGGVAS